MFVFERSFASFSDLRGGVLASLDFHFCFGREDRSFDDSLVAVSFFLGVGVAGGGWTLLIGKPLFYTPDAAQSWRLFLLKRNLKRGLVATNSHSITVTLRPAAGLGAAIESYPTVGIRYLPRVVPLKLGA